MSWQQLLDIYAEATDQARAERSQPPVACPNDGTPLQANSRGQLGCPFDGYTWPGGGC